MSEQSDLKRIIDNQEALIIQIDSLLHLLRQEVISRTKSTFKREIPQNSCIISYGLSDHDYGYAHWRNVLLKEPLEPFDTEQDENGEPNLSWFDRIAAIEADLEDYEERIQDDTQMDNGYRRDLLAEVESRRRELGTEDIWLEDIPSEDEIQDLKSIENQSVCNAKPQVIEPKTPVHKAIAAYLVEQGNTLEACEVWKHFRTTSKDNFYGLIERTSKDSDAFYWQNLATMGPPRSLCYRSFTGYVSRVLKFLKENPAFFEPTLNGVFGHGNWELPVIKQNKK